MITSKNNELVKECIKLKSKKYSRESSLCLVESFKLVRELCDKHLVDTILVTLEKRELVSSFNVKIEEISEEIARYISDSVTTDGVFAICKIPKNKVENFRRCLILDRIQDPTNLGAIIRSAKAFGFNTILTINSVYPYSFKAIRSSMGHVFSVNFLDINYDDLRKLKTDNNLTIFVADMDGECVDNVITNPIENIGIIIGNEGSGVSEEISLLSDKTISIPMSKDVESLNASVSAGIIMYLLK